MGIEEVVTAYRSPWQNAYVERLNGSIRRECTDHIIAWTDFDIWSVSGIAESGWASPSI
jgi:transposase InsO family protein